MSEFWTQPATELLATLGVSAESGLDTAGVQERQEQYGPNRLQQARPVSLGEILVKQFKNLIVLLLAVAAGVSFAFGEIVDALAVLVVIFLNAAIGFAMELNAVRSMEALQKMGSVKARVRRNGREQEVNAEELVPGDIVIVEGGDVITADMRLIESSGLQANESTLTGESVPVEKQQAPLPKETPLAERSNMLYKGTGVTRGAGEGVLVGTGMATELGQISALVQEAHKEFTPLEKRLESLGRRLVWVVLVIIVVVAGLGIARGRDVLLMIGTGVALAVAAIPEGLPIVATIALARGMMRMARRNALVNRLAAVETLGSASLICTDKTGTLTENQMTVTRLALPSGDFTVSGEGLELEGAFHQNGNIVEPVKVPGLYQALEAGVLCNNASLGEANESLGDPVEVALLVAGAKAGLVRQTLLAEKPEVREVAFDPDLKLMATIHRTAGGQYQVVVKGAPEAVLAASTAVLRSDAIAPLSAGIREEWLASNEAMAGAGLRVLALAGRPVANPQADPYQGLTFLGLAGLLDPPREEVQQAIAACRAAGIRVVMVTGDQAVTARNIGQAVGLLNGRNGEPSTTDVILGEELDNLPLLPQAQRRRILEAPILARVTPRQKLDLIEAHQKNGAVVAMTGDGVNDAPALKKADIGIAMGLRGTQVAQEAADMVLRDDSFATIAAAIEEGRIIYGNIRKFVLYLISCNVSEVMVVFLASLVNAPLPVQPLQILFLNLVTDVFPALALGMGQGDPAVMRRPPRHPQEPILTRWHWQAIGLFGAARESARENLKVLLPYAREGIPIVGCEPSCILTFRDEVPDLKHVIGVAGAAESWVIGWERL
ncbi:MAG: HAD-IC family P-type ATPase, partial [Chloroflexi bacterium]|nr:HAD-IC family P-type ATPase [Chloroflexota bacterium]